jgi:hypothetical protein
MPTMGERCEAGLRSDKILELRTCNKLVYLCTNGLKQIEQLLFVDSIGDNGQFVSTGSVEIDVNTC